MPTLPTVLVIDDDDAARYLSSRLLHRLGLREQVTEAANGQQALLLLEAACATGQPLPQLILLDLNMPVLNGFELLESYTELPAHCRQASTIVVLSSSEQPADITTALRVATEFINKPLTEKQLRRLLQQYAGYSPAET